MSFQGFPKGAERFWHELAAEMSREWFAANKSRYEEEWQRPMAALLDEVRERGDRDVAASDSHPSTLGPRAARSHATFLAIHATSGAAAIARSASARTSAGLWIRPLASGGTPTTSPFRFASSARG